MFVKRGLYSILLIGLLQGANANSLSGESAGVNAPRLALDARILVLGDSLSAAYGIELEAGWVALLTQNAARNQPSQRWRNASLSGETTGGGAAKLPALLRAFRPTDLLLQLGANDFLRGYAPAVAQRNLRRMIEQSQQAGVRVWLMGILLPPNYGQAYNQKISELYQSLAQDYSLNYLPFFLEDVALNPALMQSDGLHPNAQAQPYIAARMEQWLGLAPLYSD